MPLGCQKVYTFVNLQQGTSKRCFRGSDCPRRTAPGRGSGPREARVAPRVRACARDPRSDGVSIESSSCTRHAPGTHASTALVTGAYALGASRSRFSADAARHAPAQVTSELPGRAQIPKRRRSFLPRPASCSLRSSFAFWNPREPRGMPPRPRHARSLLQLRFQFILRRRSLRTWDRSEQVPADGKDLGASFT